MQKKKKTFSTMEIIVTCLLVGSLLLSFWQARREDHNH